MHVRIYLCIYLLSAVRYQIYFINKIIPIKIICLFKLADFLIHKQCAWAFS